jgi:hypothetical protein
MPEPSAPIEARIVDFKMPFWSMVVFLVKLSIAAIPAIIILSIVGALIFAVFGGIGAALMHRDPTSTATTWSSAPVMQQETPPKSQDAVAPLPAAPDFRVKVARAAAFQRCESAFPAYPGDALMRCTAQLSDCVGRYGERPDSNSTKGAAEIACFHAVAP